LKKKQKEQEEFWFLLLRGSANSCRFDRQMAPRNEMEEFHSARSIRNRKKNKKHTDGIAQSTDGPNTHTHTHKEISENGKKNK
jgi:hypothetical protein